jgi:hypothetical protein
MESFRQALGAVYFALAEATGGDEVLNRAGDILTDAVTSGVIHDPYACAAVMALVRSGRPRHRHSRLSSIPRRRRDLVATRRNALGQVLRRRAA